MADTLKRCASCSKFLPQASPRGLTGWGGCQLLGDILVASSCTMCESRTLRIPDTFGCVCHEEKASGE